MKKILILNIICFACFLGACNQPREDRQAQESISTTAEADTDTIPAPIKDTLAEEPDTVLQPIEEVSLQAVGNSLQEMAYNKDTIEVTAGARVKLNFTNESSDAAMVHNVVITGPGTYKQAALAGAKVGTIGNYVPDSDMIVAASPLALPGQTVLLEFTAPAKPGPFDFVCTYPGHYGRMHGTLLVK